ncbi:hypothetical protein Tco_0531308 [Tanacetum coccineum]
MQFPMHQNLIQSIPQAHKSLSNSKYQHYHTIKDDGIVSRLKFIRIGEDYQEYGHVIPEVMLNDAIKQSESYQMFIKYSTGQISPRRAEAKTASRRVFKKKVIISSNHNIIFDDLDIALELGKSISKTKAEEAEAASLVEGLYFQGVPDESTVVSTTSSERTEQESEYLEEDQLNDEEKDDKDDDANDEGDDYISDNQDADDEDAETESDEDEIYKYKIRVRKDKDVEMSNAEVEDFDKGLGRVLTPVQESPSIAIVTTIPPPSVSTTPPVPQQTTTLIPTPPITTDAPIITTTVSKFDALSVIQLRVAKLEKDVSKLKKIVLFAEALAALKIQVPSVVDNYLGSKVGDVFKKELKKHTTDLIRKYYLQQIPELPKK